MPLSQGLQFAADTAKKKPAGVSSGLRARVLSPYLMVKTQAANFLASASLTCVLAGMGTGPQAPAPPF